MVSLFGGHANMSILQGGVHRPNGQPDAPMLGNQWHLCLSVVKEDDDFKWLMVSCTIT